jgi:predicted nucleic acid-binding protein
MDTVIPWQVVGEFMQQLRRWQTLKRLSAGNARRFIELYLRLLPVLMPVPSIVRRALELSERHSLSHWDSMIVAACLEGGVDTLYTEDMGSPATYDGLRLENPLL